MKKFVEHCHRGCVQCLIHNAKVYVLVIIQLKQMSADHNVNYKNMDDASVLNAHGLFTLVIIQLLRISQINIPWSQVGLHVKFFYHKEHITVASVEQYFILYNLIFADVITLSLHHLQYHHFKMTGHKYISFQQGYIFSCPHTNSVTDTTVTV